MKILIMVPHPDDEVLGCGGIIARNVREGAHVYLCIVTNAYTPDWSDEFITNRKKEIAASGRILGVKKAHFLDLPTAKLDTVPQKDLNDAISVVVKDVDPDIVYLPHWGDINSDHRLVFESSMVALRPTNANRVKRVLSYETLSETTWTLPSADFIPNVYVDISSTMDVKTKAMAAYSSELKKYPHPRSIEAIEALARIRGSAAGFSAAEAFTLIRERM